MNRLEVFLGMFLLLTFIMFGTLIFVFIFPVKDVAYEDKIQVCIQQKPAFSWYLTKECYKK